MNKFIRGLNLLHNNQACRYVFTTLLLGGSLLTACSPKYENLSDVQAVNLQGVWVADYRGCPAYLPLPADLSEWRIPRLSGYEALILFDNGEYVQLFELREDRGVLQRMVISGEKWYMDNNFILHLQNGAWPTVGLEYARDFEQGVDILRESGGAMMTEDDVLLPVSLRNGMIQIQHAISGLHDPDIDPCGIFKKSSQDIVIN